MKKVQKEDEGDAIFDEFDDLFTSHLIDEYVEDQLSNKQNNGSFSMKQLPPPLLTLEERDEQLNRKIHQKSRMIKTAPDELRLFKANKRQSSGDSFG